MISDLAPMDLLIQRIGRLHRHMIKRPKGHKEPVLYVLGASDTLDFERGAAEIYGDYLLARTQYLLTDSINLPQDISPLVQKVYGFNLKTSDNIDLKLLFTYRESYTSFKRKHIYKIQEKERLCFSRIRRIIEIIDVFTHTYYMALQNDFIPQGLHNQPVSFLL